MWGPAKTYLYGWDLKAGDTGTVYGRAPVGTWLYVHMDRVNKWCWISPWVVDLVGDPNTVIEENIEAHMPWAFEPYEPHLYDPPARVSAERQGDQVIITWSSVWMTQDDDRGYFLDLWVCQGGYIVWVPASLPDQYQTQFTVKDETGCSEASHGLIYTVEKHGYTHSKDIPWPGK